ncbi:MAG: hypothetical protein ACJAUH_002272 [Saprospiraceae bacterium]
MRREQRFHRSTPIGIFLNNEFEVNAIHAFFISFLR